MGIIESRIVDEITTLSIVNATDAEFNLPGREVSATTTYLYHPARPRNF